MPLFHLATRAAWSAAKAAGIYRAPSLESEGFIHLSTAEQWRRTALRFFRGHSDLVLLELSESLLLHPVRFEEADGGSFPHLFGPLNLEACVSARSLEVDSLGACAPGDVITD